MMATEASVNMLNAIRIDSDCKKLERSSGCQGAGMRRRDLE